MGASRPFHWIAAFTVALGTLAFLTFQGLYLFQVAPVVSQATAKQEKVLKPLLEDIEYLRKQPELSPLLAKADVGGTDASDFFTAWRKSGGQMVPLRTREALLRLEERWLENFLKMDSWQMDLTPLQTLLGFQVWYMDQVDVPPDPQEILLGAKLRLMQGARGQNPGPALREIRNLARLLLSTGSLDYVQMGITVLDMERRAHRFYDERGWMLNEWISVDRQTLRRAQRVLAALPGFLHFWTEPTTLQKLFFDNAEMLPGYCAVVSKSLPIEMVSEAWMSSVLPFEHTFPDGFRALKRVETRAQTLCAWTGFSVIEKRNRSRLARPGPSLLNQLPYSRSLFVTWSSASLPLNFGSYLHDWNAKPNSILKSGEAR